MPLAGKRIAVTRPQSRGESLAKLLSQEGAVPLLSPLIAISPCYDPEELRKILSDVPSYDWICFTSVHGVNLTLEFAGQENFLPNFRRKNLRFACIGPATAGALKSWGISPEFLPEVYQAEGLVQGFQNRGAANRKFLLLRAKGARKLLREELIRLGAEVKEFPLYEALPNHQGRIALTEALREESVDGITFTSSSTVRAFRTLLDQEKIQLDRGKVKLASIGPVTSEELRRRQLGVDAEAAIFTSAGLVQALLKLYA